MFTMAIEAAKPIPDQRNRTIGGAPYVATPVPIAGTVLMEPGSASNERNGMTAATPTISAMAEPTTQGKSLKRATRSTRLSSLYTLYSIANAHPTEPKQV